MIAQLWLCCYVFCARRATAPPDYPPALLDPGTCGKEILRRIYGRIQPRPKPIEKSVRNIEIYQRFLNGETTADLAKAFKLSVQRIRKIIRQMGGSER